MRDIAAALVSLILYQQVSPCYTIKNIWGFFDFCCILMCRGFYETSLSTMEIFRGYLCNRGTLLFGRLVLSYHAFISALSGLGMMTRGQLKLVSLRQLHHQLFMITLPTLTYHFGIFQEQGLQIILTQKPMSGK